MSSIDKYYTNNSQIQQSSRNPSNSNTQPIVVVTGNNDRVVDATTGQKGIIRIATDTEAQEGKIYDAAITPLQLAAHSGGGPSGPGTVHVDDVTIEGDGSTSDVLKVKNIGTDNIQLPAGVTPSGGEFIIVDSNTPTRFALSSGGSGGGGSVSIDILPPSYKTKGKIWLNSNSAIRLVQVTNGVYAIIPNFTAYPIAPTNPAEGDYWFNEQTLVLSQYQSGDWVTVSAVISSSPPAEDGLWIFTVSTPTLFYSTGVDWSNIDAVDYSEFPPRNPSIGRLWLCSRTEYKDYRYNETTLSYEDNGVIQASPTPPENPPQGLRWLNTLTGETCIRASHDWDFCQMLYVGIAPPVEDETVDWVGKPSDGEVRVYDGKRWVSQRNMTIQDFEPSEPQKGDMFLDNDDDIAQIYSGKKWLVLNNMIIDAFPPERAQNGLLWFNTNTKPRVLKKTDDGWADSFDLVISSQSGTADGTTAYYIPTGDPATTFLYIPIDQNGSWAWTLTTNFKVSLAPPDIPTDHYWIQTDSTKSLQIKKEDDWIDLTSAAGILQPPLSDDGSLSFSNSSTPGLYKLNLDTGKFEKTADPAITNTEPTGANLPETYYNPDNHYFFQLENNGYAFRGFLLASNTPPITPNQFWYHLPNKGLGIQIESEVHNQTQIYESDIIRPHGVLKGCIWIKNNVAYIGLNNLTSAANTSEPPQWDKLTYDVRTSVRDSATASNDSLVTEKAVADSQVITPFGAGKLNYDIFGKIINRDFKTNSNWIFPLGNVNNQAFTVANVNNKGDYLLDVAKESDTFWNQLTTGPGSGIYVKTPQVGFMAQITTTEEHASNSNVWTIYYETPTYTTGGNTVTTEASGTIQFSSYITP